MKSLLDLDGGFLRPYQGAAIERVLECRAAGHRMQIVQKPTGAGKSIFGLALAKNIGRTVWLTHRTELIDQPIEDVKALWKDCRYGVVQQGRDTRLAADIVFASIPTAVKRLDRDWGEFDLVVVDEVQHCTASTYLKILERLNAQTRPPLVVGLTATPRRADKKSLSEAGFTCYAYRMVIAEAIRFGYLVPYVSERVVLPQLDLSRVKVGRDGDYNQTSLAEECKRAHIAEHGAREIVDRCAGRKVIVFTVDIDESDRVAAELRRLGRKALSVSENTHWRERKQATLDFKSGALDALVNVGIFTEGYNEPSIGAVAMLRPTRSKALYIQCCGRGLRPFPNKQDCLILDFTDASKMSDLQQQAETLSRPEEVVDLPVAEEFGVGEEDPPAEEKPPPEPKDSVLVDSLLSASTSGTRHRIQGGRVHWIEAAPNLFALPVGDDHHVVLFLDGAEWRAEVGGKGQKEVLVTSADVGLAQAAGEAYAKNKNALGLSWKAAVWTAREATQGQLGMLSKLKTFTLEGGMTQGEASDLITAALVRSRYRSKAREGYLYGAT